MGFNRVSFLHTGLSLPYLSGAYPRRASTTGFSSISHFFYYPQHVRGRDFYYTYGQNNTILFYL